MQGSFTSPSSLSALLLAQQQQKNTQAAREREHSIVARPCETKERAGDTVNPPGGLAPLVLYSPPRADDASDWRNVTQRPVYVVPFLETTTPGRWALDRATRATRGCRRQECNGTVRQGGRTHRPELDVVSVEESHCCPEIRAANFVDQSPSRKRHACCVTVCWLAQPIAVKSRLQAPV